MKLRTIIICLLTFILLSSFLFIVRVDSAPTGCTCNQVGSLSKSRSGIYVSLTWGLPVGGSAPLSFSYVAYPNSGGGTFSGTTGGSQITIQDNNQGGTIVITTNCKDINGTNLTCQSTSKTLVWTPGN